MDRSLLDHLTALARVELTADELATLQQQLGTILGHFQQLADLPDLGEPGSEPASPFTPPLRADQPGASLPRPAMLGQAPEADGEFYRVPRIVEG